MSATLAVSACAPPASPRRVDAREQASPETADPDARAGFERLSRLAAERARKGAGRGSRLGPGDLVEIAVLGLEEMQRTVRVSQAGEIILPLVGSIFAAGRTELELARAISARLSREYLQDPQVDVLVVEYRSELVAVTGAVARPGLYPLTSERRSILDLLSEAGGPTDSAGGHVEFLPAELQAAKALIGNLGGGNTLGEAGEAKGIPIELSELMRGTNPALADFQVVPGDVVFVPEGGSYSVEGWVERPGTFGLARGTTALGAISSGGGTLFPAALSRVEVLRNSPGSEYSRRLQRVDLSRVRAGGGGDLPLRAGDVVRVPANPVLVPAWVAYEALRQVVRLSAGLVLF